MEKSNDYTGKAHRVAVGALILHLPIFAYIGWHFETGIMVGLILGAVIVAGPIAVLAMARDSKLLPISIGVASLSCSALMIHLGRGMIEMHFHVFLALACLIGLGSRRAVLAGAVTIAVHHVSFYFLLPASVFNYEATFGIVVLHAAFVIAETIPAFIIADKFRRFIDVQFMISGTLNEIAESVKEQTGLVDDSSQRLARGASEQAAAIEETSASLEELSSVTKSNSEDAQQAKDVAGKARALAEEGAKDVASLNEAMAEIRDSSHGIAQILKSIDEIAFQTNILALNAAVEAARAGEAGAGFAVVADEVRSLAQRSAVAAQETAEKIEASVTRSERGAEMSTSVSERLDEIFKISCEVDDITARIASASTEQNSGIDQINSAVIQIDRVIQDSATISDQNAKHSGELNGRAEELSGIVDNIAKTLGTSGSSAGRVRSVHQPVSAAPVAATAAAPVVNNDVWDTPERSQGAARKVGDDIDVFFN